MLKPVRRRSSWNCVSMFSSTFTGTLCSSSADHAVVVLDGQRHLRHAAPASPSRDPTPRRERSVPPSGRCCCTTDRCPADACRRRCRDRRRRRRLRPCRTAAGAAGTAGAPPRPQAGAADLRAAAAGACRGAAPPRPPRRARGNRRGLRLLRRSLSSIRTMNGPSSMRTARAGCVSTILPVSFPLYFVEVRLGRDRGRGRRRPSPGRSCRATTISGNPMSGWICGSIMCALKRTSDQPLPNVHVLAVRRWRAPTR